VLWTRIQASQRRTSTRNMSSDMLRRPETQRVAEFLYDLLVSNAPTKDYAKRVAERMNLPYASLARYWQGRAAFPAGLVRSLFLATNQNIRVAEFILLEGTDFRLERSTAEGKETDITRALMVLNKMEGAISGMYLEATHEESEGGRSISYTEAKQLAEALRKLARIAEELRDVIKTLHPIT
jgi:hypothetical protein